MKLKSRVQVRKSTKSKILEEFRYLFGEKIESIKDQKFETASFNDTEVVLIDDSPLFFKRGDKFYPTVRGILEIDLDTNTVIVDKGAIPHIINGADVMCPGIVDADENIGEGDYVIIKEESHKKPLAVGYALMPGSSMRAGSGKAIKSVHYVGDDLWNINA